jgi:cytochrome c oxidase subunit 2
MSMDVLAPLTMFRGPLQGGIVPTGTRQAVFQEIFLVFLLLGTLVGVVVIGYMVYNGYKYRDSRGESAGDIERPELGELPEGGGGGRKLALSLTLSAIIVIALIAWTYGTLLYVEQGSAATGQDQGVQVNVTGYQFGWEFEYSNGYTTDGTLRVPRGERVSLTVTSRDVFHNFGIPAFKTKADAIPGQQTDTWFRPTETGTYRAQCFELCGAGHSAMDANVIVMNPAAYERWYANTTPANGSTAGNNSAGNTTAGNATANTTGTTAA